MEGHELYVEFRMQGKPIEKADNDLDMKFWFA
jgi:hypothetical protein